MSQMSHLPLIIFYIKSEGHMFVFQMSLRMVYLNTYDYVLLKPNTLVDVCNKKLTHRKKQANFHSFLKGLLRFPDINGTLLSKTACLIYVKTNNILTENILLT